ncbi:MAG: hypothetical protein HYV03_07760 [Deltaproteobacteria bacterium]|nr:hypothetical protein [Deltaproteobacteria bacterium]
MEHGRKWAALTALTLLVIASACASGGRATRGLKILESEGQLKRTARMLDARLGAIRTLRFSGTLEGEWLGQRGTYQMAGALRWPSDLRLEVIDPAVGTVALLLMSEGELTWYLPHEERAIRAEASARTVGRATGLPWSPSELISLIAGLPPMEYGERYSDWWMGPDGLAISPGENAVMSLADGNRLPEQYIRFREPERRHVEGTVTFSDYRSVKGTLLPHELRVELTRPRVALLLRYERFEPSVALGPAAFAVTLPEGTRVVQWR